MNLGRIDERVLSFWWKGRQALKIGGKLEKLENSFEKFTELENSFQKLHYNGNL